MNARESGNKLDFNPNNKKPDQFVIEWATYVPTRSTKPQFSIHKRRGDALNAVLAAISMNSDAILYRWEDGKPLVEGDVAPAGKWVEVWRVEDFEMPDDCDNCGRSMLKTYSGGRDGRGVVYNQGNATWIDTSTSPRLVTVCDDCARHKSRTGKLP